MAQAQQNPVQQNAMARSMLMQTALPIRKRVAALTNQPLGAVIRQRLLNTGLTTKLVVHVQATVNITATAAVSPTMGAYGLIPQVILTDYNQIERINTDAASLQIIEGFKRGRGLQDTANVADYPTPASLVTDYAAVPTAIANGQAFEFFLTVPVACNPEIGDLRGMSLSQAVVGEQFLTLNIAQTLVNADPSLAPYISGTATLASLNITIWQEYYQPQDMLSLPLIDLSTIYEVKGLYRSSSDIATNGQKLINYPNVRTVLSSYHSIIDNGAAITKAGLSSIQLLINSSQILREDSFQSKRREMVNALGAVPPAGAVFMNHRGQPISTAIYGNVQMALNWAAITGGNTYALSTFESLYASGTPLPGISTQG